MMACGRPVIAYGRGGAAETVIDGVTGVLVDEQTPEAFAAAIAHFETLHLSSEVCRRHGRTILRSAFSR